MKLCSEDHDEVCFEGRVCPACDVIEDRDREVARLEHTIESLRDEIRLMEKAT